MLAPLYLYKATGYLGERHPKRNLYVKRVKHPYLRMPDGSWRLHKGKITVWVLAEHAMEALEYARWQATSIDSRYLKEGYYAGPNFAGSRYRFNTRCKLLFMARVFLLQKKQRAGQNDQ